MPRWISQYRHDGVLSSIYIKRQNRRALVGGAVAVVVRATAIRRCTRIVITDEMSRECAESRQEEGRCAAVLAARCACYDAELRMKLRRLDDARQHDFEWRRAIFESTFVPSKYFGAIR